MQCPDCGEYRHAGDCQPKVFEPSFPKTCPFCGAAPGLAKVRVINSTSTIYQVGCEDEECVANPQVSDWSLDGAWRSWNTRAPIAEPVLSDEELAGAGRGMR